MLDPGKKLPVLSKPMPIPSLLGSTPHDFEAHYMTPRWLEILKLEFRDPHLGIAATFGVLILLLHYSWIPPLEPYPWLIPLAWFGLLLFGILWILQVIDALTSSLPKR